MQSPKPPGKSTLSKVAIGLVSIIIFFSVLTQRMMITTENSALELLATQPWIKGFRPGNNVNMSQLTSKFSEIGSGLVSTHFLNNKGSNHVTSLANDSSSVSDEVESIIDEVIIDDVKTEEVKIDDVKIKEVKTEEVKIDDVKIKEFRAEEVKAEEVKIDEIKSEEVKIEKPTRKHSKRHHQPNAVNMTLIKEINDYHPHISPRTGTDISKSQQMAILHCPNQSKCIIPELQLEVKLKVYFCRHPAKGGVRFYYLMKEGLLLHPNVDLVEEKDMYTADYVIYLPGSAPWHKTECTNTSLADKMIVMDEFDGHTLFSPRPTKALLLKAYGPTMMWYFMYFKRSFVTRRDGKFIKYPHFSVPDVYPMTYALAEAYLQHQFNFDREIEILCTLRGSASMSTRQRVQEWVAEYGVDRKVKNVISAQIDKKSRTVLSRDYFIQMYNASIIVTVNPANWEGDFRLWESFATGALVMVDPLFVPHSYPLIDGVHVVYYSNQNKSDLFYKLDYYRENPEEARAIAIEGYLHTMKYHRTVNLVDYVLRSAHLKKAAASNHTLPNYTFTAQYINEEAKKQQKDIQKGDRPGSYHGHVE
jgi:Glycosyl transferases group 1